LYDSKIALKTNGASLCTKKSIKLIEIQSRIEVFAILDLYDTFIQIYLAHNLILIGLILQNFIQLFAS